MYKFYTLTHRKIVTIPTILLLSAMLSGCSGNGLFSFSAKEKNMDYSSHSCDDIWTIMDETTSHQALYWLQVMRCTKQLSATGVQVHLNLNAGNDWPILFKRSILLAQLNGSENEQKQILEKLAQAKKKLSGSLLELMDLWIKNQQLQIAFNLEKGKYQRLKESSEAQTKELSDELQALRIKLKSLTEIERQLPTRKSAKNDKSDTSSTASNGQEAEASAVTAPKTESELTSPPKDEQTTSPQL
jgi:hypothetical protein